MKHNYHTHTTRCHHAFGTEREYVEAAIKNGLKTLGFSDHTPYPFPEDHSHRVRMRMHEIEEYINTILSLRDEYQSDIDIHLGLEVEYFPQYFDQLLREIADYPIEYFLLGQHWLGNSAPGEASSSVQTKDPAYLKMYCDQVIAGLDTGLFTYLAHPDMIYFTGDPLIYEEQMGRICQSALKHQIPVEINFLGYVSGRHYPTEAFWKIAGQAGCDVIFGIDAHKPEHFEYTETLAAAQDLVRRHKLNLLENVTLKRPV